MKPVALTIAGSDPSGGAGIQADLKTFHQFDVYGMSVITLLTVQNTQRVSAVEPVAARLVREQLEAVLEDIPPQAAKSGALGTAENIEVVADCARRAAFPLVVDPVMISKHGAALIADDARQALVRLLLPEAFLLTPNLHEAAALTGSGVEDVDAICSGFPELPVILLRTHRSLQTQLALLMRKHKNLYFTHALNTLYLQLEQVVELVGADRVLFGSQAPYWDPSLPIGMLNYAELSRQEKKLVAGDNLRRLLGL